MIFQSKLRHIEPRSKIRLHHSPFALNDMSRNQIHWGGRGHEAELPPNIGSAGPAIVRAVSACQFAGPQGSPAARATDRVAAACHGDGAGDGRLLEG